MLGARRIELQQLTLALSLCITILIGCGSKTAEEIILGDLEAKLTRLETKLDEAIIIINTGDDIRAQRKAQDSVISIVQDLRAEAEHLEILPAPIEDTERVRNIIRRMRMLLKKIEEETDLPPRFLPKDLGGFL